MNKVYLNILALACIAALVPVLPTPDYAITLLNYIGLAAIVVVGLVLLTGVGGLISFGQAAFVGIGAYATAFLTLEYGVSPWLGLIAGLALTVPSAYLIGLVTLRMSGHYLPLATIAWGIAIYYLFGNLEFLGKYDGLYGIPALTLFGLDMAGARSMFYLIWATVLLSVVAVINLLNSRPGRAIRALNGGGTMAEAMGVNTGSMKIIIFVFAAALASVSGWLYAHLQRAINPSPFGVNQGIEYLFMGVVGGLGHVWGAIAGATALTFLKDSLQDILPGMLGAAGNFEIVAFGLLVMLILQYAPEGMWPFVRRFVPARAPMHVPHIAPKLPVKQKPAQGDLVLEVRAARKAFGGLVAVNDVSFEVGAGEIVGLIGPNGAGKSTTFHLVTGLLPVTSGQVLYRGEDISDLPSREIVARGIGRTFQHVNLLPTMTVLENVALGAHLRGDYRPQGGVAPSVARLNQREEDKLFFEAAIQLDRVGLKDVMHVEAGSLPLGQQRILEIARALCADPALLLLDEPAAGLRYKEKEALANLLRKLRNDGMSVLLVEHDMDFVMNLTDRLVVMEFGAKIAEGTPEDIQKHPAVIEAYLGGVE